MPVTFQLAAHAARKWNKAKATSALEMLKESCATEHKKCTGMLQSSFSSSMLQEKHVSPSENGLVWACFEAYSSHHHLTLRPEDIWFAILSQTGFYVNGHAEELRELFVAHEGQEMLSVCIDYIDFAEMAKEFAVQIQKNVLDPDLRAWVMPEFSTTTDTDRVVASILMMGAMQKYFQYYAYFTCGIPSVTLLGEKEDWMEILRRIPKLEKLGSEPVEFAKLLKPILHHFIESFDNPESPRVQDFWSKIGHRSGWSGPPYISGWITAFCFWDEDGKSLFRAPSRLGAGCELDRVLYHCVDTDKIPAGSASVPVMVETISCRMAAGSVGIQAMSSGGLVDETSEHYEPGRMRRLTDGTLVPVNYDPAVPTGEPDLDLIQPVSGWWMYKVEKAEKAEEGETPGLKDPVSKSSSADQPYTVEDEGKMEKLLSAEGVVY